MNIRSICIRIELAILLATGLGLSMHAAVSAQGTTNPASSISLKGALTSIQNDPTNNSASWIVSGVFRMNNMNGTAATGSSPTFNSTFYMVRTDGTSLHTHEISDLQLTGQPSTSGNSTVFNGTSTVTMREGPLQNVPTSLNLMDDSAVSIWLDPTKLENHFGDTPIYGTQHLVCVESPQYCK